MAPPGNPPPPATKYFWGDVPEPDEYYASQGIRHAESYFQSPHGRLFTHAFHPLSAAHDGDVKGAVFMTHGYGSDSSWLFQTVAIAYARWGYAVFCADLLGHGRSDGVRGYLGDMEAAAAASLAFFLSVRTGEPYARLPAFLFGESMGGAVTLLMYLRSPRRDAARWTGLILSAPLLVIPDDMYPSRVRLFLYGLLFGLADTWAVLPDKRMVGKAIRDPEKLRVIASNPRLYRGAPRVGTMRELARVTEALRGRFVEVEAPFLAVHGLDDGVTAPEGSRMLYERAPSEDKELILYDGMYHSLLQGEPDESRDRVLADMRRWIDERVRRHGPAAAANGGGGEEKPAA
ncbi:Caffeoylshikimate esterase [Dichanthelium oligosanthes]|uniref:Caffeoylshikimate esterase n=1 Tax=Dichanthelium oligosanthes TaxID=888268 RepID=A0A1E5VF08_9POAL|nr:Caffeoylshikimate esterase [Dichanthelium oligosanthes]